MITASMPSPPVGFTWAVRPRGPWEPFDAPQIGIVHVSGASGAFLRGGSVHIWGEGFSLGPLEPADLVLCLETGEHKAGERTMKMSKNFLVISEGDFTAAAPIHAMIGLLLTMEIEGLYV
jgi:hypothetical protein